ncbi:MAG: hypothetical protein LBF02_00435 [Mycoplasmataceae bacterium]|nr:hypothetical protein [Mycoplasmataceae bacterium]
MITKAQKNAFKKYSLKKRLELAISQKDIEKIENLSTKLKEIEKEKIRNFLKTIKLNNDYLKNKQEILEFIKQWANKEN